MDQRRVPADEHADGPRSGAGGVLGLRADQLAADDALPEGVARALPRRRAARDRGPFAGLLVRALPGAGAAGRGATRAPLSRAAGPRARAVEGLRQHGLAG